MMLAIEAEEADGAIKAVAVGADMVADGWSTTTARELSRQRGQQFETGGLDAMAGLGHERVWPF